MTMFMSMYVNQLLNTFKEDNQKTQSKNTRQLIDALALIYLRLEQENELHFQQKLQLVESRNYIFKSLQNNKIFIKWNNNEF